MKKRLMMHMKNYKCVITKLTLNLVFIFLLTSRGRRNKTSKEINKNELNAFL